MKIHRIQSLIVVPHNMVLTQAKEGREANIQTSRRILNEKIFDNDNSCSSLRVVSKTEKDKRISYWRVEGVNALVLVYPVATSRGVDRVQVFRQRHQFHGEKSSAGV